MENNIDNKFNTSLPFKEHKTKYIFTWFVIFLNASVVFSANRLILTLFFLFIVFYFFRRKKEMDFSVIIMFLFLSILIIIQSLYYNFYDTQSVLGMYVRFLFPFFVIKIIGKNYAKYFINIVYVFTLIAFIFYIPSAISPTVFRYLSYIPHITGLAKYGQGTNFLFYTVEDAVMPGGIRRLSGPFFEPGQYAAYLIFAIIFNLIITGKFFDKKNILFYIALVFTFSTMGYSSFFLLVIFYIYTNVKSQIKYITIVLVMLVGYTLYVSLDFMSSKVEKQMETVTDAEGNEVQSTGRFGTTYNEFVDSWDNPLIGKGKNAKTRFSAAKLADPAYKVSNGLFDIAAKYGWIFWFLYFWWIYLSLKELCKFYNYNSLFPLAIILIIFTLFMAQSLYAHSAILVLLYYRNVFTEKEEELEYTDNVVLSENY